MGGAVAEVSPAPVSGTYVTLFRLVGADMNSTADQAFTKMFEFSRFIPLQIIATNASTPILLSTGGIYTATAKGGIAVVAASQAWTGLTSTTKAVIPAISQAGLGLLTTNLYLSLTTPMGSAATCDMSVMGVAW